MLRILLALFTLIALPAQPTWAEEVVLGLSHDKVAITATFDGSEILIFGAVKREAPIQQHPELQVVITISGPSSAVTVRRKARVFGIWVNTEAVEVDAAPSFYAIATSAPFAQALSNVEDQRHKISIPRAIRSVGAPMTISDAQAFSEAVIRIRTNEGLYQLLEDTIQLDEQTLFRTSIKMPANLTEGEYTTRIFLTRGGKVVSQFETMIDVDKVGLERWLYDLSRQKPLWYGLMSLAIAIAAGWGASAAFQLLRQS